MKIKTKELVNNKGFIGHMILDCFNKEAAKTIDTKADRDENTEHDIQLIFNGVELDIRGFCKHLEEEWDRAVKNECKPEALKMFEKMKHEFKSKNSMNAQLSKIREQLNKATTQLSNVSNNLERINKIC
jgi:DNA repair ATPase RecN